MINTLEQAKAVQARRASRGLRGYAKAVRRYLKKNFSDQYLAVREEFEVRW